MYFRGVVLPSSQVKAAKLAQTVLCPSVLKFGMLGPGEISTQDLIEYMEVVLAMAARQHAKKTGRNVYSWSSFSKKKAVEIVTNVRKAKKLCEVFWGEIEKLKSQEDTVQRPATPLCTGSLPACWAYPDDENNVVLWTLQILERQLQLSSW